MIDELTERVRRVRTGLRTIDGCTTRRVPATEAAELCGEFWSGTEHSIDPARLRQGPLLREAQ
jgi:hypothetical protein